MASERSETAPLPGAGQHAAMKKIAGWKSDAYNDFYSQAHLLTQAADLSKLSPAGAGGEASGRFGPLELNQTVPVPDHPGRRRRHPQAQAHPPAKAWSGWARPTARRP